MFELHVEIADDGRAAFHAEAGEGGDLKPLRGEALAAAVREVVWYADGFEEAEDDSLLRPTPPNLLMFLSDVRMRRFKRGVFLGEDTLRAFELLEPYTEYLHMKDALFADASVVPVGEGDGNVKAILSAVSKRSGDVMLTLEPHLQVFDGLQNLETGGETKRAMPKGAYESHAASFKAASDALHALLREIGA